MEAVLYVAHGTRVKEGVIEATKFLQSTMAHISIPIQQISFLELAEPTILEGAKRCIEQGATKIFVIPILLLSANHLKIDIPEEIAKVKAQFPHIEFVIGKAFGIDDRLVDVLKTRLDETGIDFKNQRVLLIGRGSSDEAVLNDLNEIANRLKSHAHVTSVDTCFLYGKGQPFEEALQNIAAENERIFIIPYLLFSGLLKNGITKKIEQLKLKNEQVILCDCLGYDAQVQQVLIDRINETIC